MRSNVKMCKIMKMKKICSTNVEIDWNLKFKTKYMFKLQTDDNSYSYKNFIEHQATQFVL